ncbi:hypothetical protein ACKVMT_13965 [Halobacteriales archaeon Cl-PHB]
MSQNPASDADAATTNAVYRALSVSRRRRALRWLADNDAVPLAVLAGALADAETGMDPAIIRLELYHVDVPKLEAAGLVQRSAADLLTTTDRGEAAVAVVEEFESRADLVDDGVE